MIVREFFGCCTAQIAAGLGGSKHAMYGDRHKAKGLKSELRRALADSKRDGNAVLCITTTTEQEDANKTLDELGFRKSEEMRKKRHRNTKLILWWYPVQEYTNPNGPKRDAKGRFIKKEIK